MELPQEVRETVAAINRALDGLPESCTLPILCEQYEYTVPCGSATLLQLGEGHYLGSARHVFTTAAEAGSRVFVGGVDGPGT
jgi:hypothetical protein